MSTGESNIHSLTPFTVLISYNVHHISKKSD